MDEIFVNYEHNDKGVLLWAARFPGAFARGKDFEEAAAIAAFLRQTASTGYGRGQAAPRAAKR